MANTIVTASLLGLAALGAFIVWSSYRLGVQHEAYRAYEACVADEYGTTPAAFYQMHGSYPECSAR